MLFKVMQPLTFSRRFLFAKVVITGFNTDIEFQGTTYHVQTEDKGVKTPLILSLVYDRGTILASKRSAYNDLLIGGFDEKALTERLQKQHNLICAAVRAGRIEDLKRMAAKEAAAKQNAAIIEKPIESANGTNVSVEENFSKEKVNTDRHETFNQKIRQENFKSFDSSPIEKIPQSSFGDLPSAKNEFLPETADEMIWDVPLSVLEDMIVEEAMVIDDELILSDEAVEIISEYIEDDPVTDTKLKVRLLGEEKFKSGARKTIRAMVKRGNSVKGLSGTQVIIKVLGSSFTPLIFHAKTDDNGVATVDVQFPQFKSGRAAILIKAMSDGEEADLRRAVTQD
jgi:hypothetical protein